MKRRAGPSARSAFGLTDAPTVFGAERYPCGVAYESCCGTELATCDVHASLYLEDTPTNPSSKIRLTRAVNVTRMLPAEREGPPVDIAKGARNSPPFAPDGACRSDMKLETQSRAMILATAIALAGCGDDGSAAESGGSTGASTTGAVDDDDTTPGTSTMPGSGSTSSVDTTGGSSSGGSDTGGGDSSGSSGGSEDSGDSTSTGTVDTATLSGIVSNFGTSDVLPGIEVCVFEQGGTPCATTDAKGAYSLMGVPVAEGAIEFTGNGRFPSLFWGEGPMDDEVLNYNLLSNVAAAVLANALGEEIDDNLGHLALAVSDGSNALSEVTFTMTPSSGAIGYLTSTGIDPELTATTEVGFAGWLNVDVGEVEITATHPTLTCVPGPGALVGSRPDALRIDVTAAYLGSTFPFFCS